MESKIKKLDEKLYVLLGRVKDSTLIEDFGATQSQLDDARLLLGIPEPSKKTVSSMEFALAWQRAESIAEVCLEFGMARQVALMRANQIRRRKIPLKVFPSVASYWDAIRDAVERSEK